MQQHQQQRGDADVDSVGEGTNGTDKRTKQEKVGWIKHSDLSESDIDRSLNPTALPLPQRILNRSDFFASIYPDAGAHANRLGFPFATHWFS